MTEGLRGNSPTFEIISFKKPVISGVLSGTGIARTLNPTESNSVVLFDDAVGTVYTLPVAVPGLEYKFFITTPMTGSISRIITNVTTHTPIIVGHLLANITNQSPIVFNARKDSLFSAIRLNAITTGAGLDGGAFTLTALSEGTWFVSGLVTGSNTLAATPFSVINV